MNMRRFVVACLFAWGAAFTYAEVAEARVGGGHSYSGGSSRSSSSSSRSYSSSSSRSYSSSSSRSSGPSRPLTLLETLFWGALIVGFLLFKLFENKATGVATAWVSNTVMSSDNKAMVDAFVDTMRSRSSSPSAYASAQSTAMRVGQAPVWRRLLDADFSDVVFLEWSALLYMRWQEARASGQLDVLTPFLSVRARQFPLREAKALRAIRDVVIGGIRVVNGRVEGNELALRVMFTSNYSAEFTDGTTQRYFVRDTLVFKRNVDAKTLRTPDRMDALGCPNCGAPFERSRLGTCASCGTSLQPGASDWYVDQINTVELQTQGPVLTGYAPEVGTNNPTVVQPNLAGVQAQFLAATPGFSWSTFEQRAKVVFTRLQQAWSAGQLEGMRPYETDNLFQQHRFWMEEYQRQKLQNRLDDLEVGRVVVAKVDSDNFYDAITCRIFASARDYTVSTVNNRQAGGDARTPRSFSEYWTFVRRKGVAESDVDVSQCPSCRAPLQISQTGICAHCQAKVTRGNFSWVLSRIEQDEEYAG